MCPIMFRITGANTLFAEPSVVAAHAGPRACHMEDLLKLAQQLDAHASVYEPNAGHVHPIKLAHAVKAVPRVEPRSVDLMLKPRPPR